MHRRRSLVGTFLLAYLAGNVSLLAADSWNQWRGPNRNSLVQDTSWPEALSADRLQSRWSMRLGPSYSGPVMSSTHVFVTETRDKSHEVVRAIDRVTGKEAWKTEWKGAISVPFFAAANGSWIRSTPTLDGKHLYVAGIRDVLVCLEAETGKIAWKLDFVAKTGSSVPSFGCVSSPLVTKDAVFVQAGSAFYKVNKTDGAIVWKTLRDGGGMNGGAFSSPVLATIGGTPQLVVQSRSQLCGVDVKDGKVLWSVKVPAFRGMNILTPSIIGNSIFTSSYGGGSSLYDVSRSGGKWTVEKKWTSKTQGYMSSPVVIDGFIYLHLRNQRFVCIDAATGKERWRTKTFGKYWSMIANGQRILALDERGDLLLIEASPEKFEIVGQQKVADDSWAHLAIDGGQVYIRDLRQLRRFDWK